jgi:O-methyltransferase
MIGRLINVVIKPVGFVLQKSSPRKLSTFEIDFPDFEQNAINIIKTSQPYTMTSAERLYGLYKAMEYLSTNRIEGDIVECGVWKGGSSMCALLSAKLFNDTNRHSYLYDTYEGMSEPTEKDTNVYGDTAVVQLKSSRKQDQMSVWCYSPLEEVEQNIKSTGYPIGQVHFVKGKVEDTIPGNIPEKIALLRLDTDWYESTYHELTHLFPRLVKGGVIIIDDYGHWKGAREAVDQYFKENNIQMLLNRLDYTGRIGIKL